VGKLLGDNGQGKLCYALMEQSASSQLPDTRKSISEIRSSQETDSGIWEIELYIS
jgi:hypothetical protein